MPHEAAVAAAAAAASNLAEQADRAQINAHYPHDADEHNLPNTIKDVKETILSDATAARDFWEARLFEFKHHSDQATAAGIAKTIRQARELGLNAAAI